jgi:hypothetical protein
MSRLVLIIAFNLPALTLRLHTCWPMASVLLRGPLSTDGLSWTWPSNAS